MRISLTPKWKISTIVLILYIWLGMFYARVSYHLGGTMLILFGYILLACVLFPWKIQFREEDREISLAVRWFLLFALVVVGGNEIFRHYTAVKTVGPITMSIDTFHMIKSFPIWLSFMLIQGLDKDAYKHSKLILIVLFLGMALTLHALITLPNFSRSLTAGIISNDMRPYLLRGAMGYELTYSIVLVVPLLFAHAFYKKKIWIWAMALLAVYYIIKCNFFLAIALMFANGCFALIFMIKSTTIRRIAIAVAIASFIVLLINQTLLGNFLLSISERVESYELSARFRQLSEALLYDDYSGRTLNRLELYKGDFMGILRSPLFGCFVLDPNFYTSGHSTVMGLWSAFGLLGIVPFFQVVRHLYRHTISGMQSVRVRGMTLAAFLTFMLFAVLDPVFADPHIFACVIWVVPTLARSLVEQIETDVQESETHEDSTD